MRGRGHGVIAREIRTLRGTLRALDRSLRRIGPVLSAGMAANGPTEGNRRSRPRLSARARASLVLQGRYMGYMRQLEPRKKAQVRKIRKAKGVRAAIQRAREMRGSRHGSLDKIKHHRVSTRGRKKDRHKSA